MSVITINTDLLQKNSTSIGEILLLLCIENKINSSEITEILINKGYITQCYDSLFKPNGYRVTNLGNEFLKGVILDSIEEPKKKDLNLETLAQELKNIFPKGKKEGTNYYWAESTLLIIRRLKLFFKKYGTDFTNEQIIEAADKYVKSFNGSYKYMKLLKYFICKEKIGIGGDVEGESELLNYIENAEQTDILSDNWAYELK